MPEAAKSDNLRRAVRNVALLNFGYFFVEFSVALAIASVALFADSVDFLEDTAVNLLILVALGWSAKKRARVGMGLAAVLLVPGLATIWTAWNQFAAPVVPDAVPLSAAGLGALIVNVTCATMLARYRDTEGSLTKAAFLSARNDAVANVAIIAAGIATMLTLSHWPDLIVGIGIFLMNLDAAVEVYEEAMKEHSAATHHHRGEHRP
ncbi:MAG: cation transporter [Rhodospirillaceae bacterium]|nr:cation transporter [Rhodospirillaceae bacterium]